MILYCRCTKTIQRRHQHKIKYNVRPYRFLTFSFSLVGIISLNTLIRIPFDKLSCLPIYPLFYLTKAEAKVMYISHYFLRLRIPNFELRNNEVSTYN